MERKWLWKKKSSEKGSGETESSGSVSSHSERYSDEQEALKASPNHDAQSPEVTSKAVSSAEDESDRVKNLTQRLSAALVNVSAKEDLVKQHAKVAEEAVAGWEKAENEASVFKLELEATMQQNSALEDRVSHLDGALKECVRQLRQAREEQEQSIQEAVVKKTREWESIKLKLESQITELQKRAEANRTEVPAFEPHLSHKLQSLEKENSALKRELMSQVEELELRTIERDLSTQAAETASKQHLESIKKVARLEAECRRLKNLGCKTALVNDHKSSAASSMYVESCMDSQSDSGERLNMMEIDSKKMNDSVPNKRDMNFSDSWASALVSELDQFKNEKEKPVNRTLPASVDIDLMDDFLEMEQLASLPQPENGTICLVSEAIVNQTNNEENALRAELEAMSHQTAELEDRLDSLEVEKEKLEAEKERLEAEKERLEVVNDKLEVEKAELEATSHRTAELEDILAKLEVEKENLAVEKAELETALAKSRECFEAAEFELKEAETKLEELQKELNIAKESKKSTESQLISIEAEARTLSAKVNFLEGEVQRERALSTEIAVKCQSLEEELSRKNEEVRKTASSNCEVKIKQEDLAVAAGKLAECQKTIASLGNQLKSLATLEDFLIDSANLPGFAAVAPQIPRAPDEQWKLHSNVTFSPKRDSVLKQAEDSSGPAVNRNEDTSPPSSSSSTASNVLSTHVSSDKNRNGFAKFFSRTKSGIRLEI